MMKIWKTVTFTAFSALTLAACNNSPAEVDGPPVDPGTGNETSSAVESAPPIDQNESVGESSAEDSTVNVITLDEALDVYWQEYPEAQIEGVDFDKDWGEWTYEITGVFDNREYEVEINAVNSEIMNVDEDDVDNDNRYLNFDSIMDPQEAIDIARQEVAEDATLEGWNLDVDDDQNRPEYEIEFEGTDDRDVTLHAETGDIIEIDN